MQITTPKLNEVLTRVGELRQTEKQLVDAKESAETQLAKAEQEQDVLREVQTVFEALAESQQEQLRKRVQGIVDRAVKAVFGPRHHFQLDATVSRGQLSVVPMIGKGWGKGIVWDELEACGGGMHDIVSFAMRIVVLSLTRPKRANVIVADEPFKHVSRVHLGPAADMVRQLSDLADMQIIIVSHKGELADVADTVYRVTMDAQQISQCEQVAV